MARWRADDGADGVRVGRRICARYTIRVRRDISESAAPGKRRSASRCRDRLARAASLDSPSRGLVASPQSDSTVGRPSIRGRSECR